VDFCLLLYLLVPGAALAAQGATKDEAVAMVKKASSPSKPKAPTRPMPRSATREARSSTATSTSWCTGWTAWSHGADKNRIGTNLLHDKDVDGKEFVKERIDLAKTASSFWQSYKFMNPVSKTIEPKEMYCERLNDTVVCSGVYQS
jgi:cytochrome c